jgi:hypothetical protein
MESLRFGKFAFWRDRIVERNQRSSKIRRLVCEKGKTFAIQNYNLASKGNQMETLTWFVEKAAFFSQGLTPTLES